MNFKRLLKLLKQEPDLTIEAALLRMVFEGTATKEQFSRLMQRVRELTAPHYTIPKFLEAHGFTSVPRGYHEAFTKKELVPHEEESRPRRSSASSPSRSRADVR